MIAVQGPNALAKAADAAGEAKAEVIQALKGIPGLPAGEWFIARTGYTGEDGWKSCCRPKKPAMSGWR